jgi:hypothetical protein
VEWNLYREYIIIINVVYGFHTEKRESMGNIPKMFFFFDVAWVRAIQEIKPQTFEVGRSHPNPHGFLVNLHPRNLV